MGEDPDPWLLVPGGQGQTLCQDAHYNLSKVNKERIYSMYLFDIEVSGQLAKMRIHQSSSFGTAVKKAPI
jgi:hypothetical protein